MRAIEIFRVWGNHGVCWCAPYVGGMLVSRGQTAYFSAGRYRLQYKRPH